MSVLTTFTDAEKERVKYHLCRRCGQLKPEEAFVRGKNAAGWCLLCNSEKARLWRTAHPGYHAQAQRAYRKRHPERIAASLKKWLAEHPEYEKQRLQRRLADPKKKAALYASRRNYEHRKRANGGSLTNAQIREILSQPCRYCGGKATELDHVVPVSRGGAHSPENVAPSCLPCNRSKGARTPTEWKSTARMRG